MQDQLTPLYRISPTRLFLLLSVLPMLAAAADWVPQPGRNGFSYPASLGEFQCVRVVQTPIKDTGSTYAGLPTWTIDKKQRPTDEACEQMSIELDADTRFMPVDVQPSYSAVVYVQRFKADGTPVKVQPYFLWNPPLGRRPGMPRVTIRE